MKYAVVSKLPVMRGDGFDWGGEFVVVCPMLTRFGTDAREMSGKCITLVIGPGMDSSLTAEFIAEAINTRLPTLEAGE